MIQTGKYVCIDLRFSPDNENTYVEINFGIESFYEGLLVETNIMLSRRQVAKIHF
jgi:hypothetical protein